MRKIISFMHVSLDGFVAGPNGEMNWIKVEDEIFEFVEKRISQSDTALYGRVTYQLMESYWPTAADQPDASRHDLEHSKWYKHAHKVVLSRSMQGERIDNTTIISDDIAGNINALKDMRGGGGGEILLFGSPTATHALMQQNLIDGYWLFVNPMILGEGIPLFAGTNARVNLKLLDTHTFNCGVVALNYLVDRN